MEKKKHVELNRELIADIYEDRLAKAKYERREAIFNIANAVIFESYSLVVINYSTMRWLGVIGSFGAGWLSYQAREDLHAARAFRNEADIFITNNITDQQRPEVIE